MDAILHIPELAGRPSSGGLVRIPPEQDVPLTPRVRRLIDTAAFRRLADISQLGLVRLVYPAAVHSRQEHSLGVYRVARQYLLRLACDERFADHVTPADAAKFLVAALLHDIGHWPFCHPLEDMSLADVPAHESLAGHYLQSDEVSALLAEDWQIEPADVVALLTGADTSTSGRILSGLLSGPIDVDKVDYLMRDSLHAGVPYGRNFDANRLVSSLCLNQQGDGLAITDKGKTAAEMMVFSRYVMFSEVYWHHTVRSATAMLQRAFYALRADLDLTKLFAMTEPDFVRHLCEVADGTPAEDLLSGLFGSRRVLYKRLAEFSAIQRADVHARMARRPYEWLVACARQFRSTG